MRVVIHHQFNCRTHFTSIDVFSQLCSFYISSCTFFNIGIHVLPNGVMLVSALLITKLLFERCVITSVCVITQYVSAFCFLLLILLLNSAMRNMHKQRALYEHVSPSIDGFSSQCSLYTFQ